MRSTWTTFFPHAATAVAVVISACAPAATPTPPSVSRVVFSSNILVLPPLDSDWKTTRVYKDSPRRWKPPGGAPLLYMLGAGLIFTQSSVSGSAILVREISTIPSSPAEAILKFYPVGHGNKANHGAGEHIRLGNHSCYFKALTNFECDTALRKAGDRCDGVVAVCDLFRSSRQVLVAVSDFAGRNDFQLRMSRLREIGRTFEDRTPR